MFSAFFNKSKILSDIFIVSTGNVKRFAFAGFLLLFLSTFFSTIAEFGAKKYFTDHRAADTIQLFVSIKENFSDLFFF